MTLLDKYMHEIKALCERHRVKKLYAFGSVLTKGFNDNSDIDLIVDFESTGVASYADNYFDLKFSLQDLLNRPIDLLEEKAMKNPYFQEAINDTKQLIYGH